MERDLAGLVYACSCLYVFVIIPCFGQMVKYVEFVRYLRSVESGTQKQFTSSLFG
jgi:hypothetical protein